ncbi:Hypothetical predicted protein [Mytilus galloprovincialis]|nr:Hypothetical predicted protein [Mytilus galloprovincialis]
MVTSGLMLWWINSVSGNQIPGKYRTTQQGGADIQEDAEAVNGLQGKRNLKVLIEKINFQTFYQDELNLSDVMSRTYKDKFLTLQGVFFDFARNLLFLNHECRDRILHDKMKNMIERGILFERENFRNYIFGCNVTENKITLNPLDLIITLFVCSSPKLKQVLTEKLFACRLAFPFSIPFADNGSLQVQLWPLRSIFLECTVEDHLFSINSADCPCVVVSFLRLGRPSFSKSHLINSLLSNQHNDLFHNKDCPLSEKKRYIGEGTIEATWYVPSMSSDFLSEKTLILNLRGDGMNWEEQRILVSKISTVIVVVVSLNDFKKRQFQFIIRNLYQSNAAIHLVIDPDDADRQKVNEHIELHLKSMGQYGKTKIILLPEKEKQRSHFKCEIKKTLQQSVNAVGTTESLASRVERCKVNIDEQHIDFRTAKDFAVKMMDVINSSNRKEHCLPLQNKPWRVWSQKLKTVNKSSLCPTLQENGKLRQDMIVERQQQLDICEKLGPLMTRFIKSLTDLLPSDIRCRLFISWLKMILAERTSKILCKNKQKHTADLGALENALNKNADNCVLKLLQQERYQIDNRCSDEIIGIEHLLREMGQMYEAVIECEARKDSLQIYLDVLPTIAAKLVMLGEPFELLDGDVMNVPLIWLKAVLKKVTEILGDKRLLTVTVLGKTGTGKSSLLNTLFGSQFPVHTKGALMQLIPLNSQTEKFDFILVIDTEGIHGIQAPDSNQKRKSNEIELTTFVIGLSDAILVNMGEGRIAEQKNALDIVVQSLLRIKLAGKKLNLKQICHFVLQELPDHVDMKRERMNLQNALDDVAKNIICQEKTDDLNSFKDIIDFDCNRNVWFLPLMRNTNEDVKPPTPQYGECVNSIRDSICREVIETRESFLTITDTISRIEDLWNAILKDDFVLSFCSSLEQKAYDHMEGQYQLTSWNLEKYIMEFIVNKAKQKLVICKTRNDLEKAMQTIQIYLSEEVNKKESNLIENLESLIEGSSLKDIMSQWKRGIRERLTKDKNKYVTKAEERIQKIKENVREKQKGCFERVCKEMIINEQIAEQAQQLQTEKITDTLLEEKFNQVWEQRIETLESQDVKIKVLIKDQIMALLQQEFPSDAEFVGQLGLPNTETYGSYNQLVGTIDVFLISTKDPFIEPDSPPEKCRNQTIEVANHIFQKIDTKFAELGLTDIQFDLTYVQEILEIVVSNISEHNLHLNNTYKFDLLPKFQALIMIHAINYATEFFSRRIKVPCEPQTDDYKTTAWCYFKNIARGETEDVIACGFFNAAVVKVIEEQVSELLPMEAQGSVQGILSHGKQTLIKRILIDLAEKEDFMQYKAFIKDPYTYAEKWILELTNRKMFEEHTEDVSLYAQLAKKQVSQILNELGNIVIKAIDDRNTGMSSWVETFVTKNNECNTLALSKDIFVHVENRNVTNLQTFSHALTEEIVEMRRRLFSIYEHDTAVSVQWITNPVSEILDKLWGCLDLCVFCKEPCMITSKDHVMEGKLHECVQHRPLGIGGYKKSDSKKMVVDFCSHKVSGDQKYRHSNGYWLYKEYKEHFPDWEIPPSSDTSKYWIWVMCKFQNELAEMYSMKIPDIEDIPEHWTSYTKQIAIDSL